MPTAGVKDFKQEQNTEQHVDGRDFEFLFRFLENRRCGWFSAIQTTRDYC